MSDKNKKESDQNSSTEWIREDLPTGAERGEKEQDEKRNKKNKKRRQSDQSEQKE